MTRRTPLSDMPPSDADQARTLWQKYRSQPAPALDAPTVMDLAAYADGKLRGAARDQMEAYLARHPQALADVIAARAGRRAQPNAKPSLGMRLGLADRIGWGAALCGFCLALWLGFATGEQVASADSDAYALYTAAGEDNVDL